MKYIILGLISLLVLFIYSACVVSSRCSREEEKWRDSNEYSTRIRKN